MIVVGVAVGVAVRVAVAVAVAVGVGEGMKVKVGVKLGVAVFLVVLEQEEHGSHPVPTNRVATAKNKQMASPAHREIIVGLLPVSPEVGLARFVSANHPREMRTNICHSAIKVTKPAAIALFGVCSVQAAFEDRLERRSENPALREDRQMPVEWQMGRPLTDRLVRRLTGLRPHITVVETAL